MFEPGDLVWVLNKDAATRQAGVVVRQAQDGYEVDVGEGVHVFLKPANLQIRAFGEKRPFAI